MFTHTPIVPWLPELKLNLVIYFSVIMESRLRIPVETLACKQDRKVRSLYIKLGREKYVYKSTSKIYNNTRHDGHRPVLCHSRGGQGGRTSCQQICQKCKFITFLSKAFPTLELREICLCTKYVAKQIFAQYFFCCLPLGRALAAFWQLICSIHLCKLTSLLYCARSFFLFSLISHTCTVQLYTCSI